jgi:hypothetical protein
MAIIRIFDLLHMLPSLISTVEQNAGLPASTARANTAAPLPKAPQPSFYSSTPSGDGPEFVAPVTLEAMVHWAGKGSQSPQVPAARFPQRQLLTLCTAILNRGNVPLTAVPDAADGGVAANSIPPVTQNHQPRRRRWRSACKARTLSSFHRSPVPHRRRGNSTPKDR